MSIRHYGAYAVAAVDTAATSITGDIDIRVLVSMDNWIPAASGTLISKDAAAQRSYNFYLDTAGKLNFFATSNGSTTTANAVCSVATGFAAKTKWWVRATWSTLTTVKFFSAPGNLKNPVAADFTQMGSDVTAALTGIFDGTAGLEIGGCFGGTVFLLTNANTYRAQVRNGIDGTLVADFDPSVLKIVGTRRPIVFTDAVGQTWFTGGYFNLNNWDWAS